MFYNNHFNNLIYIVYLNLSYHFEYYSTTFFIYFSNTLFFKFSLKLLNKFIQKNKILKSRNKNNIKPMQDKECATLSDTKSMQSLYITGFIDSTKMTFFKKLCTTFVGQFYVFFLVVVGITVLVGIPLLSYNIVFFLFSLFQNWNTLF